MSSINLVETLFKAYRNVTESSETLFTVVIHNSTLSQAIEAVNHRYQLAKEMKPGKKKNVVCSRLLNFRQHLEANLLIPNSIINPNSPINSVFLVNDEVHEIKLILAWIKLLKEYKIDPFIFKYQSNYALDYLENLLTDLKFYQVIYVQNYDYQHIQLNSTKRKIIFHKESRNFDLLEYLKKTIPSPDVALIHGVSSILKTLNCPPHMVLTQKLEDHEILDKFKDLETTQIHQELDTVLAWVNQSKMLNRLIYGKSIEQHLTNQSIKTLYCTPDMYTKVMARVPLEVRGTKLQVKLVPRRSNGDPGDQLIIQFGGLLGITYY